MLRAAITSDSLSYAQQRENLRKKEIYTAQEFRWVKLLNSTVGVVQAAPCSFLLL